MCIPKYDCVKVQEQTETILFRAEEIFDITRIPCVCTLAISLANNNRIAKNALASCASTYPTCMYAVCATILEQCFYCSILCSFTTFSRIFYFCEGQMCVHISIVKIDTTYIYKVKKSYFCVKYL